MLGCWEGGNPADTSWQPKACVVCLHLCFPSPAPGKRIQGAPASPPARPPCRLNLITADTHLLLGSKTRSSQLKDSHGHGKLVLIAALMVVWPMSSPKWP